MYFFAFSSRAYSRRSERPYRRAKERRKNKCFSKSNKFSVHFRAKRPNVEIVSAAVHCNPRCARRPTQQTRRNRNSFQLLFSFRFVRFIFSIPFDCLHILFIRVCATTKRKLYFLCRPLWMSVRPFHFLVFPFIRSSSIFPFDYRQYSSVEFLQYFSFRLFTLLTFVFHFDTFRLADNVSASGIQYAIATFFIAKMAFLCCKWQKPQHSI